MSVDPVPPDRAWDVKLRRAGVHVSDLRERVERHLAARPFDVVAEPRDGGRVLAVRMTGDTSIPVEWSAIVGDALHNLRSSLDCFVVGLVESNLARALTTDEERLLQFPICATPTQWNDQVVKGHRLDNVGSDAVEEIRRLQPFYVHELAGLTDNNRLEALFETSYLGRLASLSNTDKHRRVHLAAGHAVVHWLATSSPSGTTSFRLVDPPPWSDGAVICEWTLDDADKPSSVHALSRIPPQVGSRLTVSFLSDIESKANLPVVSALEAMYDVVAHSTIWAMGRFIR